MSSLNESSFSINVTAASGELFAGTFKVRRRLSHMQSLRRDELRRELLGARGEGAPQDLKYNAFILSTCAAYVINGPRWWDESSNGVDLLDVEPVAAVFNEISKILDTVAAELDVKSKKAVEALKAD